MTLGGRPTMPPPGVPTEELLIARFRTHARRLFWSAIVLIGVFGATTYFYDNLPAPFENWMLLSAAGALVLLLVVVPFVIWYSRSVTVTTRRVIVNRGIGARNRQEMSHARGYSIAVRRGAGTGGRKRAVADAGVSIAIVAVIDAILVRRAGNSPPRLSRRGGNCAFAICRLLS